MEAKTLTHSGMELSQLWEGGTVPKFPGKSWERKCSNEWTEVGLGPGVSLGLSSPPGENQTVHPMATPAPAPTPSPQIGASLITYILPPPGGKGHGLL